MTVLVDTSVLIDYLRDHPDAVELLERERLTAPLHGSEITRLEILSGMRASEEHGTRALLSTLVWHPVDADIAERAGALGREWLSAYNAIDSADLAIAATALYLDTMPLTRNVKHFPMFEDLRAPY